MQPLIVSKTPSQTFTLTYKLLNPDGTQWANPVPPGFKAICSNSDDSIASFANPSVISATATFTVVGTAIRAGVTVATLKIAGTLPELDVAKMVQVAVVVSDLTAGPNAVVTLVNSLTATATVV